MNNLNGNSDSALLRIERLLKILVKLRLEESRGDRTQNDMIFLLDRLDCGPSEIAELLGTTANTVSPILSRAKRKANGVGAKAK